MGVIFEDLLPGETPIDDRTGLKVEGIRTRAELGRLEAANIRKVITKYFGVDVLTREIAPFDFSWAQRLHREMFEDVWDWAGLFRTKDFNLGVPFPRIQEGLYNLFEDMDYWDGQGLDVLERATRLHHRSVQIHPFANGNGRWARMLTNVWLALQERPTIRWPERLIGDVSPIRDSYVTALKAADEGDISLLLEIHRIHQQPDEAIE